MSEAGVLRAELARIHRESAEIRAHVMGLAEANRRQSRTIAGQNLKITTLEKKLACHENPRNV